VAREGPVSLVYNDRNRRQKGSDTSGQICKVGNRGSHTSLSGINNLVNSRQFLARSYRAIIVSVVNCYSNYGYVTL